jgi:hypothetical protein
MSREEIIGRDDECYGHRRRRLLIRGDLRRSCGCSNAPMATINVIKTLTQSIPKEKSMSKVSIGAAAALVIGSVAPIGAYAQSYGAFAQGYGRRSIGGRRYIGIRQDIGGGYVRSEQSDTGDPSEADRERESVSPCRDARARGRRLRATMPQSASRRSTRSPNSTEAGARSTSR